MSLFTYAGFDITRMKVRTGVTVIVRQDGQRRARIFTSDPTAAIDILGSVYNRIIRRGERHPFFHSDVMVQMLETDRRFIRFTRPQWRTVPTLVGEVDYDFVPLVASLVNRDPRDVYKPVGVAIQAGEAMVQRHLAYLREVETKRAAVFRSILATARQVAVIRLFVQPGGETHEQ